MDLQVAEATRETRDVLLRRHRLVRKKITL